MEITLLTDSDLKLDISNQEDLLKLVSEKEEVTIPLIVVKGEIKVTRYLRIRYNHRRKKIECNLQGF